MGTKKAFWAHTFRGCEYTATEKNGAIVVARGNHQLGRFTDRASWNTWCKNLPAGMGPLPNTARISSVPYEIIRVVMLDYLAGALIVQRSYSADERADILARYFASGLTRAKFARLEGVPKGTVGRWANKARKQAGAARRSPRTSTAQRAA